MAILNRKAIDEADDIERRTIPVAEWGGDVIVQGLSAAEHDKWEDWITNRKASSEGIFRASLVVRCLIDEDGNRLYGDQDAELMALSKKSGRVVDKIYSVAAALSGVTKSDADDLIKNFVQAPSDNSVSGSPETSDGEMLPGASDASAQAS